MRFIDALAAGIAGSALALCGVAPAGAAGPAGASAFTMGEVGKRAPYGVDGAWDTSASPDGALVLAGRGEQPGWTADIVRPPGPVYTVEVKLRSDIAPAEGRAVGAGIVFGFQRAKDAAGPTCFAALVAGDTLSVYALDGSFHQLVRSSGGPKPGGFDVLRVSVKGDGFSVSLNDNGSVSQSTDRPTAGEFGVMASGSGQATFRDLVVR